MPFGGAAVPPTQTCSLTILVLDSISSVHLTLSNVFNRNALNRRERCQVPPGEIILVNLHLLRWGTGTGHANNERGGESTELRSALISGGGVAAQSAMLLAAVSVGPKRVRSLHHRSRRPGQIGQASKDRLKPRLQRVQLKKSQRSRRDALVVQREASSPTRHAQRCLHYLLEVKPSQACTRRVVRTSTSVGVHEP